MLKTFQYRIYPTSHQKHIMLFTLEECRWLYNHFLESRKNAWEQDEGYLNYHSQATTIPKLKKERYSLNQIHSQVLQNVAVRIDLSFKAFFRRVKLGEKPGYPRFRGRGWYDSFTYPQTGFTIKAGKLFLSKIGDIKIRMHRSIQGTIKTLTIRRLATGKWYASFSCDVVDTPLPESTEVVGIDVGLSSFATLSTEEKIDNPRFFRTDEKSLVRAQRNLSKLEKGTPERQKSRKVVSHIHERITNRRNNFTHQESRKIVNRFGIICVEDIHVNRMVHNHCLAKSIMDVAWGQFDSYLSYKAESAGRKFVAINPSYTTQDCSRCGHRQIIPLSERTYHCSCCDLTIDRDYNASLNILARGLASLASA
jgi:putative transposase